MDKSVLEGLGLTPEQMTAVMAENQKDVDAQQDAAAAKMEELSKMVKKYEEVDVEGLKAQLSDAEQKHAAELANIRRDNAIDMALIGCKARNGKAVRALLNMDAIQYEGGTLKGLDEQIEAIRKENSFLFGDTPPIHTLVSETGGKITSAPPTLGGALTEHYNK